MDVSQQLAAPHGATVTATALPHTDAGLADMGSVYPMVAYGGIEDAAAHEDADDTLVEHGEELDEVIFSGMVALR